MNRIFQLAVELQEYFKARQWSFCIIGGLAVLRWGQPRTTEDVDFTLLTGFGGEKKVIEEILARFTPRIPDAAAFAGQHRVLLIENQTGIQADISLGAFPFEEEMVKRSSEFEFGDGVYLRTCSAEDLVILKSFASRPLDWIDVEGILIRQQDKLDWDFILRQLTPLGELKEAPEIVAQLQELRKRTEA